MAAAGRRRRQAAEQAARSRLERLAPAPQPAWLPSRPLPSPPAPAASADPPPTAGDEPLPPALADLLPPTLRAATVAPARRNLAGLLLLVAVAVSAAFTFLALARPDEDPAPRARLVGREVSEPDASGAAAPPSPSAPPTLFVHVAGAVRRPGLVELPPGARVADAVQAAGGLTARAAPASVNLARPVADGEQVVVLRRGQAGAAGAALPPPPGAPAGPAGGPAGSATPGAGQPVDLNTATLEQLDALPGIGPVLAQRILDWRTANGRFSTVEELGEVSGIGEATLADLRPFVAVAGS